ncbi:unnamed protein product [Urochloa humidicola]
MEILPSLVLMVLGGLLAGMVAGCGLHQHGEMSGKIKLCPLSVASCASLAALRAVSGCLASTIRSGSLSLARRCAAVFLCLGASGALLAGPDDRRATCSALCPGCSLGRSSRHRGRHGKHMGRLVAVQFAPPGHCRIPIASLLLHLWGPPRIIFHCTGGSESGEVACMRVRHANIACSQSFTTTPRIQEGAHMKLKDTESSIFPGSFSTGRSDSREERRLYYRSALMRTPDVFGVAIWPSALVKDVTCACSYQSADFYLLDL